MKTHLFKTIGLSAIALSLSFVSVAQTELKVGDSMPNYELINLINHSSKKATLSSFNKRLVILEFWSTSCTSCIEAWPKLIKLQKEFDNAIQIVLVNAAQDEKTVRAMFDKRRKLAGVDVSLPTVCTDSVLSKMFPRIGVPHVIWIDKGTVRSITEGSVLNNKVVSKFLRDARFTMPQAWRDDPIPVDFNKPLFANGNGGNGENLTKSSTLASYSKNMVSNISIMGDNSAGRYDKVTAINCSLAELYGFAYSDRFTPYGTPAPLTPSRIRFEGFDSTEYAPYVDGIIQTQNHYTYQLISPPASPEDLQTEMQNDLRRLFGFHANVELMKIKCRVLKANDTSKLTTPIQGDFIQGITESNFSFNGGFYFKDIIWDLENVYKYSTTPIVAEVNMKGIPAGVHIETDVKNPDKLDEELRKYGMSFKEEIRKIKVLVIRKTK
jgi:thiol-disulfide isomerase/thioredoxin